MAGDGCPERAKDPIIQYIVITVVLHYIIIIQTLASIWPAFLGYFPSPWQFVVQRVLS